MFNRYIKPNAKQKRINTTVSIERVHSEFIRERNLNLSKIVRDTIDQMIREYRAQNRLTGSED